MLSLSLDHITAVDTTPVQLAEAAHAAECRGICLFMEPMEVLPHLPQFDIYGDLGQRREFGQRMKDLGIALDLAYPFTLAGRTEVDGFKRAMECAAELDAQLLNALMYDRNPERKLDTFGQFCDLARSFGLRVGVEFYPVSQVRSLAEALELVQQIGRPGEVGINADLLHLMRSGGTIEELAAAPEGYILYGQLCDGAESCPEDKRDYEASSERLLAGEGVFDLKGFAEALPEGCPMSVELPRNAALEAGVPVSERVRLAIESVRQALEA
ncbi:xylose isomerase [Croceicoccus estronivorus]|uniref:sugar phosphate isomerase/epimerase family protein n=1 Tax=Croceicoccus estronivorus TaxID=1172626 RepID=UPI0008364E9D|nr:TIM barrel protein [Croceicoccus estronivorus]OCC25124.1 xylose isomerase [Croceicoccus estronivorus]